MGKPAWIGTPVPPLFSCLGHVFSAHLKTRYRFLWLVAAGCRREKEPWVLKGGDYLSGRSTRGLSPTRPVT